MSHHHKTVEIGGWTLLVAAIAFLVYLLFHKDGQAALTGQGTLVQSKIVSSAPVQPMTLPTDPSSSATLTDAGGNIWLWNVAGQQWILSSTPGLNQPTSYIAPTDLIPPQGPAKQITVFDAGSSDMKLAGEFWA
jgi:hypothetical protein